MEPLIINEDARVARARELFVEGYNCCQAVAMTFADVYGVSEELMSRLAAGFGGGIGRMRETCGAVCGMVILAGLDSGPYPNAENKLDRDANDTFDLLDEIEKELGIATCPINWPIGSGKAFKGVYDREKKCVISYSDTEKGTKEGTTTEIPIEDEAHLRSLIQRQLSAVAGVQL